VHYIENGRRVAPNMPAEKALCRLLVRAFDEGWSVDAHDLSEGGLAVAAAEIAITGGSESELKPARSHLAGARMRFFLVSFRVVCSFALRAIRKPWNVRPKRRGWDLRKWESTGPKAS